MSNRTRQGSAASDTTEVKGARPCHQARRARRHACDSFALFRPTLLARASDAVPAAAAHHGVRDETDEYLVRVRVRVRVRVSRKAIGSIRGSESRGAEHIYAPLGLHAADSRVRVRVRVTVRVNPNPHKVDEHLEGDEPQDDLVRVRARARARARARGKVKVRVPQDDLVRVRARVRARARGKVRVRVNPNPHKAPKLTLPTFRCCSVRFGLGSLFTRSAPAFWHVDTQQVSVVGGGLEQGSGGAR